MPIAKPKTVLILGAGASKDCNFPLGSDLINMIIAAHEDEKFVNSVRRILYNCREYIKTNNLMEYLPLEVAGALLHPDARKFYELPVGHYTDWVKLLGPFRSIDEFISYHKKYSILAKLSILLVLSQNEVPRYFENKAYIGNDNRQYFSPGRSWYNALWGNLVKKGPASLNQLLEILKTIHVITFNYDRSLDYFFLDSMKKFFPESEGLNIELPITHVYGSLGTLNSKDELFNPYKPIPYMDGQPIPQRFSMSSFEITSPYETKAQAEKKVYDLHLLKLATSIETYGIEFQKTKAKMIQETIIKANNNNVFGFSFFEKNMEILFKKLIRPHTKAFSKGKIDGTCFKVPGEQIEELANFFDSYFGYTPKFMTYDRKEKNIKDFFADHSIKI